MGRPKKQVPQYSTDTFNGYTYYRTRITDADGKRISLRAKSPEELEAKKAEALRQIAEATFRLENPTVAEYCEKWLTMKTANIRETTLADYRSKVKQHIIKPLGNKFMVDVTPDDINIAILPASKLSQSIYQSVQMLYKAIFESAAKSHIIQNNPAADLNPKGGKPPKETVALTDEQVGILLDAIRDLPPYPFVMIGLYAGLRREETLALKWDSIDLDSKTPTIKVCRAWHTVHNRPVISEQLKTRAARRVIPIPPQLVECLKSVKAKSTSDYVFASNIDGGPLSYTQFARLWKYVTVRSTKPRTYTRYLENGEKVKHTVTPVLGEAAAHNSRVIYSMDFQVKTHQLRRTYITNLIYANVDPKTVQYLAGHENIKETLDIYAKVKYNRPEDIAATINSAFSVKNAEAQAEEISTKGPNRGPNL